MNGEGNTKRTMYANVSETAINIILDPIFIYVLNSALLELRTQLLCRRPFQQQSLFTEFLGGKTFLDVNLRSSDRIEWLVR